MAVTMTLGVTAACGGSGAKVHSVASHSAGQPKGKAESLDPRAQAVVLSEKQLNVVAFSDADFPLLKRAPRNDHTGVLSISYKADAGGPECTTFLNAQLTSGSYYHGLHEVDKGYTLTTTDRTVQLVSAAISYSSAREAERVITDARTSIKHCSNLRYRLRDYSFSFEEIASLPIPLTGDDSTAFQESWRLNGGKAQPWATELIRVGTVVVSVNATSSPDPIKLLRQTGKRAATELRHEEERAADAPAPQTG
ncbi:sensor domain-containing protein [Streptomyces sp. NPDC001135]